MEARVELTPSEPGCGPHPEDRGGANAAEDGQAGAVGGGADGAVVTVNGLVGAAGTTDPAAAGAAELPEPVSTRAPNARTAMAMTSLVSVASRGDGRCYPERGAESCDGGASPPARSPVPDYDCCLSEGRHGRVTHVNRDLRRVLSQRDSKITTRCGWRGSRLWRGAANARTDRTTARRMARRPPTRLVCGDCPPADSWHGA
jgi:hypothetical protein